MRNALVAMIPADMRQPEFARILVEHFDDAANFGICHTRGAARTIDGRQIVVGHREMLLRPARSSALHAKLIESEEGLAFVDQVEIDVKQFLALRRYHDDMVGPDFLEQRPWTDHCSIPSSVNTARFSS